LEGEWAGFEAEVKKYVESCGKQIEQQQATFQEAANAQLKAWREAANKFQGAAGEFAASRRADVDAAVQRMKADAAEAEGRLRKLGQVGTESWTALSAALADSRAAFDRANQAAQDAFKRAAARPSA
jgi:hypothetical protein